MKEKMRRPQSRQVYSIGIGHALCNCKSGSGQSFRRGSLQQCPAFAFSSKVIVAQIGQQPQILGP
jgi:hypothetical protein